MKLLTVSETAEILSVSKTVMYELLARGDLPYITAATCKGYRIDPDDLAEFIRLRKVRNERARPRVRRPRLKHIKL